MEGTSGGGSWCPSCIIVVLPHTSHRKKGGGIQIPMHLPAPENYALNRNFLCDSFFVESPVFFPSGKSFWVNDFFPLAKKALRLWTMGCILVIPKCILWVYWRDENTVSPLFLESVSITFETNKPNNFMVQRSWWQKYIHRKSKRKNMDPDLHRDQ